jgi:hypothetical protein
MTKLGEPAFTPALGTHEHTADYPTVLANAGFERVEELKITQSPTGSISLYSSWKPA